MATTKQILQHPLVPLDLIKESIAASCRLCHRDIFVEAYTCKKGRKTYYYHKLCVEAPSRIDGHPLHPAHPLHLFHDRQEFWCHACCKFEYSGAISFWCDACNFSLDIPCALSTLSDEGDYQSDKTSEQISLPFHQHRLTSFSKRHDFVWDSYCYICERSVQGDGYMCLRMSCKFIIHKGCIQDLYYADGTKAPRVYHRHPLEIFVGEDKGSSTCENCGSNKSGEFIGCKSCKVFYHRNCFQVPEILRYPSHHPDHTLVLFPKHGTWRKCDSCFSFFENEIFYSCTSCEFLVHVGCAFQVLTYCEEGMIAKVEFSWHKHLLLLCHQTKSARIGCVFCENESIGPMYACVEKYCAFLVHKRCTEIESTLIHPHHPDHPLNLCRLDDVFGHIELCRACGKSNDDGVMFSCKHCLVGFHVKCTTHFPTQKHYLHEHELLRMEDLDMECNRCGASNRSPLFRCVPCDFNLHEECMELPQVTRNNKVHWHPLTLHETFVEDDTGEYYCEHCEKTRDPRLGVYVCGQCKISLPRIYHIHCVLPELGNVNVKKSQPSAVKKLKERIADKKEEVCAIEEKLEEAKKSWMNSWSNSGN